MAFASDDKLLEAASLLRAARFDLAETDPDLAADENYLDDLFGSDPNTIDAWEILHGFLRASIAAAEAAEAAAKTAAKIAARAKRYEARADRLKAKAAEAIRLMGRSRAAFPDCRLTIGAPRKRVAITNLERVPFAFKTAKIECDKTAIRAALESGKEVPGAELQDGEPVITLGI